MEMIGRLLPALCTLLLIFPPASQPQTTKISTEFLMTLYAPVDPPHDVDSGLSIYNVRAGGTVKGPKINGTLVAPSAAWVRAMPSGVYSLDARATIKTDDGAVIHLAYNGIIQETKESEAKGQRGEIVTFSDHYFVITATFETSSKKYDWLNSIQAIGKIVEDQAGKNPHVTYDLFIIR
jgi:Protein of unknown function (DUF3237)